VFHQAIYELHGLVLSRGCPPRLKQRPAHSHAVLCSMRRPRALHTRGGESLLRIIVLLQAAASGLASCHAGEAHFLHMVRASGVIGRSITP
jgi:hypothetical protein